MRRFLTVAVVLLLGSSLGYASVEIIIDNPNAVLVGSWQTGTSSQDKYGADYRFAGQNTTGAKSATYTPDIPVTSSDWAVYTWYPEGTNRPVDAQYIIHTAAGDDIKYINQTDNGGQWNYIGTYPMNAGTGNYVRITNYGTDVTRVVMADAIRFYSAVGSDTDPPVISAVTASPGEAVTTVTWTTNEPATSQVEYGLTTSYGSLTTKDTALVMTHSVNVSGLTPNTLYHYRVKSDDGAGNPASSDDYTFTTPAMIPPVISSVAASPGETTSAVTWTTNEPATSQVEYGLTTSYGSQTTKDSTLVTGHSVSLSGLTPETLYHYRVKSEDGAGNPAVSDDYTFTTGASAPPVISAVSASPSDTSASVTWSTDEPATSQVEYGLTTSYGSQTVKDTTLSTAHNVSVTALTPNTLYHYRVKSEDGIGNQAVSDDYTFTTTSAITHEFRAMWVDTWHPGILSSSQVTSLVNTASAYNYNVIIPEVRKAGDAYYDSAYEPRATNISTPYPWDPLGDLITKAHAVDLEVHPWIVAYRIWDVNWGDPPASHIYALHPEWAMADTAGNTVDSGYVNLDPGVPGAQDYICKVVLDIITEYDIDGFNWDYIRYPGENWGYNQITRQRFYDEYGYWPPTIWSDPHWGVWGDYRRGQVTDLVKKCYLEIIALKPNTAVSVDSVGWMHGDPNVDYTDTRQYYEVFQNAKSWVEQHIVDINMLMNYKREYDEDQAPDYRIWADFIVNNASTNGRHAVDGQGAYLNSINDTITQMQYDRSIGAQGHATYSYSGTNKDGQPASDFWNAVSTNLYTSPVPTPDMPWKTAPTTGILFGTVRDTVKPIDPIYQSWIYKATVTAIGPVTGTTTTDATGTYGFMDLPPGTYSITVSKSGYESRTYPYQTLAAGQVLRRDCDLGYAVCMSPTNAKAEEDDSRIELIGPIVSAIFPGYFYVEARDRSSGLRVEKADHGLAPGMGVDVAGLMKTNSDGERYIEADAVHADGSGSIDPLELINRSLGGGDHPGQQGALGASGLNNIGLLISTTGKVTYAETGFFYVDDGSALDDGSGYIGIKVLGTVPPPDPLPEGWNPIGHQVIVTGISSCFKDGTDLFRQIRATEVRLVN